MRQHISHLLLAGLLLWIVPAGVWSQADKWNGSTIEAPDGWSAGASEVLITKASELAWVAKTTNDGTVTGGNGETSFENCTIKLDADIDLDSQEWPVIGYSESFKFKGNFDGQGFQVKNLKIDIDGQGNQSVFAGLFGSLDGSTIQNLGIVISDDGIKVIARRDGDPTSSQVGGLAGKASSSTIKNCYVTGGSILADTEKIFDGATSPYAGGLIGYIEKSTSIQDCYSTVNIQTGFQYKDNDSPGVGGLVGMGFAMDCTLSISNCFTTGNIDDQTYGSYGSQIGGILGNVFVYSGSVTISNCVTQTTIYWKNTAGGSSTDINRICGKGDANLTVTNCHALEGDRIILTTDDKGTTTIPDHSSTDAKSKDGANWDGTSSLPANIFDEAKWDVGTLPIMPKLKDTNGKLMSNQPNIRVNPHQFTFNITGNGTVATQSGEMEASKDEEVEFVVTPLNGDNKLTSLTYTSASVTTPTPIDKNSSNKYLFTMPDEDVAITAVFIEKSGITVVPPTNGAITIEGGLATAFMGDDINFTVSPNADYELDGTPSVTESGVPVSCSGSNGKYTFKMPAGAVSISATFSKKPDPVVPDPDPVVPYPTPVPPIYYTVSLPAVEGVITDPVAGDYEIESWSSFRFYLTLDKEYDKSEPVVTTDRFETITPRSSDGAYIVKYVRGDVEIFIDSIIKNPDPVANEKIEANHPKVWKTGNELHIQAVSDEPGYIFTADGKLQTVCHLIAGEVETVRLPDGIYFVRIGKERFKIVL